MGTTMTPQPDAVAQGTSLASRFFDFANNPMNLILLVGGVLLLILLILVAVLCVVVLKKGNAGGHSQKPQETTLAEKKAAAKKKGLELNTLQSAVNEAAKKRSDKASEEPAHAEPKADITEKEAPEPAPAHAEEPVPAPEVKKEPEATLPAEQAEEAVAAAPVATPAPVQPTAAVISPALPDPVPVQEHPEQPSAPEATQETQTADHVEPAAEETVLTEDGLNLNNMNYAVDLMAANRRRAHTQAKDSAKASTKKKKKSVRKQEAALKKKAQKLKIPKTAQDTIPYYAVYKEEGIIEIRPGIFTKSYLLGDVNYKIAKYEEQMEMLLQYGELLNSVDSTCRVEITINQKNINMDEFERSAMLPLRQDGIDHLRKEHNERMAKRIRESKNCLIKEKYLTVSVEANDIAMAKNIFARMDAEIISNMSKIGRATATPLSSAERLEILHDIYNVGFEGCFGNNVVKKDDGSMVYDPKEKFSFEVMRKMGLTTKDMIAPDSFRFNSEHGKLGDTFFRALYLRKIPSFLRDEVLEKLTDTDCSMLTSLQFEPVEADRALKMAKSKITQIDATLIDRQKQASKSGYSVDLVSPDLTNASKESKSLLEDLMSKNQSLFFTTLVIVHFADTKEQLDEDTKKIQSIARGMNLDIRKLQSQQELGLNSALPLAYNQLKIKRALTTESAAVWMPFTNQELNDRNGGLYYGNNSISHNLILFDRTSLKNGNGFIFGQPGSGKSMSAKQEMLEVLMARPDDTVIVIDPEGEYKPMVEVLGNDSNGESIGEVIPVAATANVHINPFDMDMSYDTEDDPLSIQSDFIISLCEIIAGDRFGLSPAQKSAIDRCVRKCYEDYLSSKDPDTGKYDKTKLPTLHDFWNLLNAQPGYEAQNLAEALEMYVTGSLNYFAYQTNVEYTKRFVVYDIKEVGSNMKAMALLIILNNIWNQIVAGRQQGKHVWVFIDEIYLLFKNESSAEFLRNMYKRARKYGGIPTGITQNVSDLLESDIAKSMISNSEYLLLLNQGQLDRAQLGALIDMSPTELDFVTNASPGHGILYNGVVKVPFESILDKKTMMYQAMTTKLDEVKQRDEQKTLEAALAAARENPAQ